MNTFAISFFSPRSTRGLKIGRSSANRARGLEPGWRDGHDRWAGAKFKRTDARVVVQASTVPETVASAPIWAFFSLT